jgi:signal transduction histidine kinase
MLMGSFGITYALTHSVDTDGQKTRPLMPSSVGRAASRMAGATVVTAIVFAGDLAAPGEYLLAALYGLPLIICASIQSISFLWGITVACITLTFVSVPLHGVQSAAVYLNRSFLSFGLLTCALVVNQLIRLRNSAALLETQAEAQRNDEMQTAAHHAKFLSAVSHDIRTPASAINLLAELLLQTAQERNPLLAGSEELPQMARELQTSAVSLVRLISDVLDIARYDGHKVPLVATEFAVADVVDGQVRAHQQAAQQKNLQIRVYLPQQSIRVLTDRVKLGRILAILLDNAVKFTDHGHVDVTVDLRPSGELSIAVTDTGCGIPPGDQERIFDECQQLKQTGSNRKGGTGLSLSIARRLAKLLEGTLELVSEAGNGTTFTLTLQASVIVHVPAGKPPSASRAATEFR